MKPSDVKNKEDFECLMRERAEKCKEKMSGGFNFTFKCTETGEPVYELDKSRICEYQKIAMGSETAYIICGEVHKARNETSSFNEGDWVRSIELRMTRTESNEFMRLITLVVDHKKKIPELSFSFEDGGEFCAFPGGCE